MTIASHIRLDDTLLYKAMLHLKEPHRHLGAQVFLVRVFLSLNSLNRQPGFRRGGLVEQDILNFFILDVDIFNLKNLYASVRQKRTKVTKETIQTFGHSRTNNNKNNIHNTNNKNTEQAKTCKILNRTHSKGNVPKTTTQRSHNHHNKVIYEYQNKRHAQEHNRETLKTTKHIKITRSQKKRTRKTINKHNQTKSKNSTE